MHLITMAHLGEAQGVIEKFKANKIQQDLYQGEKFVLVITGEGPFEAATKTALMVHQWNITEIINLGIAGTLNSAHQVGSIHPVRTIYLAQNLKPQFRTFQSSDKGLDCITTFERILDPEKAKSLKGVGELVDREAWGVAMAAKTAGLPFSSYKIVSDVAGTMDACELVQEKASSFSNSLADYLEALLNIKRTADSEIELKDFYFTFTSNHRFKTLLGKLAIKDNVSEADVLASLPLHHLREIKISPKDRAKRLLDLMEDKIDPTKKILENKKKSWLKTFEDKGFKVQTDNNWENPEVVISLSVSNDNELKNKIKDLSQLSVAPFASLMSGEFHVE